MSESPAGWSETLAVDRARALELTPVSRETLALLDAYAELLVSRQRHMNLVASSTIPHLWTRLISDSLQLLRWSPKGSTWVDIGSGAGLPGLPVACALGPASQPRVHLIESVQKKAAFLQTAVAATGAPASVHPFRVESFDVGSIAGPITVTARALAPLSRLLSVISPFLSRGATAIFPKGRTAQDELTAARESWMLDFEVHPSITDPNGRVIVINGATRRRPSSRAR